MSSWEQYELFIKKIKKKKKKREGGSFLRTPNSLFDDSATKLFALAPSRKELEYNFL